MRQQWRQQQRPSHLVARFLALSRLVAQTVTVGQIHALHQGYINLILDEFYVPLNVKYAVGTNNSTVEQLVVVMRERTTFLESEQHY